MVRYAFWILFILPVLMLQGCAGQPTLTDELKQRLVQRVESRWEFYSERDYSGAWNFSTPEYRRIFPQKSYYRNFYGFLEYELTGVQLLAYDAPAAVASVAVRVMISSGRGAPAASLEFGKTPTTIDESWKLVGGSWYYVDRVK